MKIQKKVILLIVFLTTISIFQSCNDDDSEQQESQIKLTTHNTLGEILTDKNGMSLYFFF